VWRLDFGREHGRTDQNVVGDPSQLTERVKMARHRDKPCAPSTGEGSERLGDVMIVHDAAAARVDASSRKRVVVSRVHPSRAHARRLLGELFSELAQEDWKEWLAHETVECLVGAVRGAIGVPEERCAKASRPLMCGRGFASDIVEEAGAAREQCVHVASEGSGRSFPVLFVMVKDLAHSELS
jgi:hypothetical protein